jgi:RNA polymerase sigma factor (sigma-70 family)
LHSPPDEELVAACLRHEAAAQQALYHRYGPYTLGICRRHMADDMEAEDTHQIAWMRTFNKLNQWAERGPLRAWLRRLFVNVCISAYQKRKRQNQWLGPMPDTESAETIDPTPVADFAAQEQLLRLVAALPEGARLVFNLFAVDGYSHAEIAELLNITEGNSRQQLLRARSRLAQQINGIGLARGNSSTSFTTSQPN